MLSKQEMEHYCREYYSLVFRYCMSRLADKSDAEDATQETFVVFSEKGHMINPEHIRPWLLATAHHKVLKEYQRRTDVRNRECVYDELANELYRKVESFEEALVDYYMERYISDIYERLNEREKELFDLYADGTMKTGQIAQILGLEPHACSMRKKRLEQRCRDITVEILFY